MLINQQKSIPCQEYARRYFYNRQFHYIMKYLH